MRVSTKNSNGEQGRSIKALLYKTSFTYFDLFRSKMASLTNLNVYVSFPLEKNEATASYKNAIIPLEALILKYIVKRYKIVANS